MDVCELADHLELWFDKNNQSYNYAYLMDKAREIIEDINNGVAQDPYYNE